jgi:radical SAM superfamily enzyme YgiQ (UPF0313 family)
MIYKERPGFKIRKISEIKEDILKAREYYGPSVRSVFFPDGNTIAMKTDDLCEICHFTREVFTDLKRITVYGSMQFIHKKGLEGLRKLAKAGLSRIHVGLESGDDVILKQIKKGTHSLEQIEAGRWVMQAGIELSLYVILGIGGRERTQFHAKQTARVLNEIAPDFIRLRTFVPKINTPLLEEVQNGTFQMLGPHQVLEETRLLIQNLRTSSLVTSDHYTNYINLEGRLPDEKERLIKEIQNSIKRDEKSFRPFFIGNV